MMYICNVKFPIYWYDYNDENKTYTYEINIVSIDFLEMQDDRTP